MGNYNSFLLKRDFEVPMNADFLSKILFSKNDSDFKVSYIDKYQFKVFAYTSLGTLGPFSRIKVYVIFKAIDSLKTSVTIKTKLRIEFYFITLIFLLLLAMGYPFNISIWPLLFLPITYIWFWFVYRAQENELADDVTAFLVKQPRMGWSELK